MTRSLNSVLDYLNLMPDYLHRDQAEARDGSRSRLRTSDIPEMAILTTLC